MSVVPLPEKALITRIRRQTAKVRNITAGIGDDCAVLRIPPGHEALVTTDFSLEGIHFRRDWHPPESVGHRCLTRGLSDIAAMGGEPVAAFLSLALPHNLPQRWVDVFLRGLLRLAKIHHVILAGGDTAESPHGILADITVLGMCPRGKSIRRSRARPGDLIYVTGTLGGSAFVIRELTANPGRKLKPGQFPAHFFPKPRLATGEFLRKKRLATAMIDLSDGLSTDLTHICEESGVGAEIESKAVPRACIPGSRQRIPIETALHGGEDYELLFTAAPGTRVPAMVAGIPVTRIGRITRKQTARKKTILIVGEDGKRRVLSPQGWEHFKAGSFTGKPVG